MQYVVGTPKGRLSALKQAFLNGLGTALASAAALYGKRRVGKWLQTFAKSHLISTYSPTYLQLRKSG
jgi:hypothetical protein